jgi:thioredoxin 1
MTFQEPKNLAEFKQLIEQDKLVIVDFHAVWCGPCRLIAPKLAKFTEQYSNAVFAKVDVDEVAVSMEGK